MHLDDAWTWIESDIESAAGFVDASEFGPQLRYVARPKDIAKFEDMVVKSLPKFILYGSGDFHHLAGTFVRKAVLDLEDVTLISFDNHPDWAITPPKWACGSWINRALELPQIVAAHIWGCGNYELTFPSRLMANRSALKTGRLNIHAWAERQTPAISQRFKCMTKSNWRDQWTTFAKNLNGKKAYITIDMDCLTDAEAITNWENGLYTCDEIVWAINLLKQNTQIIAGDICGAKSTPSYARPIQKLLAKMDHPNLRATGQVEMQEVNCPSMQKLWEVFTD